MPVHFQISCNSMVGLVSCCDLMPVRSWSNFYSSVVPYNQIRISFASVYGFLFLGVGNDTLDMGGIFQI